MFLIPSPRFFFFGIKFMWELLYFTFKNKKQEVWI